MQRSTEQEYKERIEAQKAMIQRLHEVIADLGDRVDALRRENARLRALLRRIDPTYAYTTEYGTKVYRKEG